MNSLELQNRLKFFAFRIVNVCDTLPKKKISAVIERQLLRSAFSSAANYRSACKAMSKKSFVSKLSIAFEEMDESLFWLEVVKDLDLQPSRKLASILKEATELASILAASRKTSQKKV
jgi:four helix bundle protein